MRSFLYQLARAIGDAKAIQKGPTKFVKRVERRLVGKLFSRLLMKIVPR
jgi:hypothetical protein